MSIADRMKLLDASGIRKVFDMAAKLKDPVNLSIGQPDFDIPDNIKKAAKKHIDLGFNSYTQTQGIPDLIDALKEKIKKEKGAEGEDLFITSGVSGGILLSFLVLFNPGDEVIIPDPYFVMYKHLGNLVGAKPVFLNTYPDFSIRGEELEKCITPKTKAIIINSPNNPTGSVYTGDEIDTVVAIAKKNNLLIISDEIYDSFLYDCHEFPGSMVPSPFGKYENVLLLNGFSKSHAMTGWRIGYACGPKKILAEMKKLQQYTFVCAPSFAQKSALEALSVDTEVQRCMYEKKRDIIYENLAGGFELHKPKGAFYAFIRSPIEDMQSFVEKVIEKNVLIIPGNVFSEKRSHFRISFAQKDEVLLKGVKILQEVRKSYG
ncbi:pyridoxal phosphate-dependent aminotransferase [Spirochaetota bacterium]